MNDRLLRAANSVNMLVEPNAYDLERICKTFKLLQSHESITSLLLFRDVYYGCIVHDEECNVAVFIDTTKCISPIEAAQYFSHHLDPRNMKLVGRGTGRIICQFLERSIQK